MWGNLFSNTLISQSAVCARRSEGRLSKNVNIRCIKSPSLMFNFTLQSYRSSLAITYVVSIWYFFLTLSLCVIFCYILFTKMIRNNTALPNSIIKLHGLMNKYIYGLLMKIKTITNFKTFLWRNLVLVRVQQISYCPATLQ